jgi:hypothetical protein
MDTKNRKKTRQNGSPEATATAADAAPGSVVPSDHEAPTTEGQRLLCALPGSLADLASTLKCARQAVHAWKVGGARPGPASRAKIAAHYGIPASSWEEPPQVAGPAPVELEVDSSRPLDELGEIDRLIAEQRQIRATGKLLPRDREANIRTEADLRKQRRDVEAKEETARQRAALLEHRIVRAVLDALKRHPQAEVDVLAALRRQTA